MHVGGVASMCGVVCCCPSPQRDTSSMSARMSQERYAWCRADTAEAGVGTAAMGACTAAAGGQIAGSIQYRSSSIQSDRTCMKGYSGLLASAPRSLGDNDAVPSYARTSSKGGLSICRFQSHAQHFGTGALENPGSLTARSVGIPPTPFTGTYLPT